MQLKTLPTPPIVRIEATSACQLKCPSCPTASGATKPLLGRGYLKLGDFEKFLDDNPSVRHVELSNYGEMFLHPDLPGLLEAAYRRRVVLSGENGVNLNTVKDEVLEAIVKYRLVSMVVSIDAASEESYSKYRVGGSFTTVMSNLKRINHFKEQYNSPFPKMRWQFIVFGHNEHEIPEARRVATELGMGFRLKLAWGDYSPVKDKEFVASEMKANITSREEFRQKTGQDYMDHLCHQLWNQPQINWDGKMLGCCRTFWTDFGGNVFADGFEQTFNSEKMQYGRAMLEGTAEAREDIPCTACSIYLDRKKSQRWVTPPTKKPKPMPLRMSFILPSQPAVYTLNVPRRKLT